MGNITAANTSSAVKTMAAIKEPYEPQAISGLTDQGDSESLQAGLQRASKDALSVLDPPMKHPRDLYSDVPLEMQSEVVSMPSEVVSMPSEVVVMPSEVVSDMPVQPIDRPPSPIERSSNSASRNARSRTISRSSSASVRSRREGQRSEHRSPGRSRSRSPPPESIHRYSRPAGGYNEAAYLPYDGQRDTRDAREVPYYLPYEERVYDHYEPAQPSWNAQRATEHYRRDDAYGRRDEGYQRRDEGYPYQYPQQGYVRRSSREYSQPTEYMADWSNPTYGYNQAREPYRAQEVYQPILYAAQADTYPTYDPLEYRLYRSEHDIYSQTQTQPQGQYREYDGRYRNGYRPQ